MDQAYVYNIALIAGYYFYRQAPSLEDMGANGESKQELAGNKYAKSQVDMAELSIFKALHDTSFDISGLNPDLISDLALALYMRHTPKPSYMTEISKEFAQLMNVDRIIMLEHIRQLSMRAIDLTTEKLEGNKPVMGFVSTE